MKLFKKLLIFTLALVTAMCFSNLLCRPLGTNAAEATEDINLNTQQLAKDFDFITKFYVEDDILQSLNSDTLKPGLRSNVLYSADVKLCGFFAEGDLAHLSGELPYTCAYSLLEGQSVAITVDPGVDMIAFSGFDLSYFDLDKTVYNAEGNACYIINETEEYIGGEWDLYHYFAYIGQSENERTVIIKCEDFIAPLIIEDITTFKSSSLSITEIATRQSSGEDFYSFVPTLSKTKSNNGIVTSMLPYLPSATILKCSAVYPEYGTMMGYYNGLYDAFFGKARKQDFEGNDRNYPSDITDKDIKKQINTAHKAAYGEFYDYVDSRKTTDTSVHYDKNGLPFIGYYAGPITDCDEFIKEYCTDNSGRIYNYVDETNCDIIMNGQEDFAYFNDSQMEYINEKILEGSGSKYPTYMDMFMDAFDFHTAKQFLNDYYDETKPVIKYPEIDKVKENYNQLPKSTQEKIDEMLTERNNGLEKTFDETLADYVASTDKNTGNQGDGKGNGNERKNYDDFHFDLSKWSLEDLGEKIAALIRNPAKFFEEVGKAFAKAPLVQSLHLILKIIVAVVVGFLLFKGIKALVNFFRDR